MHLGETLLQDNIEHNIEHNADNTHEKICRQVTPHNLQLDNGQINTGCNHASAYS